MNFTEEQTKAFFDRIDNLNPELKPSFGKMNVNQMLCHCSDFFRMANGTKKAKEYGIVNPEEITRLARSGKPTPTPEGFGQIEGNGAMSTEFENDKTILKEYILEFANLPENFDFAVHPYFGKIERNRWIGLAIYHLDHHLKQFNV